jgi:hypothetical protein
MPPRGAPVASPAPAPPSLHWHPLPGGGLFTRRVGHTATVFNDKIVVTGGKAGCVFPLPPARPGPWQQHRLGECPKPLQRVPALTARPDGLRTGVARS